MYAREIIAETSKFSIQSNDQSETWLSLASAFDDVGMALQGAQAVVDLETLVRNDSERSGYW